MKSLIITALIFAAFSTPVNAETLTARDIVEKMDTRYTGDSSRSDAQLILIDRKGRERVRDIRLYTLENEEVEKSISFFLSPTDVAGTTYMNYDYEDGRDDDSWLYLPALKQVRRVAAGDRSGSFMGSDFTYSDINGVNTDWYHYELLDNNASVDGADAWLIESTPKTEFADKVSSETGYKKSHLWIRKDNFVQVQGKIWLERGGRMKYYSATQLELIDDIWTPMRLQMVTVRGEEKEHASVFQFSNTVYNEHTDETLFTTQSMQRGIQ
ncbi:outer membrane lipoprotein-sorting protein [Gilvimarinus algae]|uniref:Outer membrane lipoprotein-sorting protein n=1 Tax=Gilvimarinus algae TaxID=3058037 RepID=A0ABT8TIU1_9GAMM|nr:outer membrane lipoprotein-sorting protein [Gilvimarinus sp. SDUM040014]MDO3384017.1 outer membrane lipoprotein-sorting protein [Gilvimarinus sp. SDUM040014]